MAREFGLYINGKEREGGAGFEETLNPYTEKPWAKIAQASAEDVQEAIEAARQAFESWSQTPGVQRAKLLNKLAELIEEEAEALSKLETSDNGKIRRETKSQMFFSARNYRFFAGMADKLVGETKPLDSPQAFDFTIREPIGVCALITPWNSPISILTNKLAPCLAAGNTCVVKPSEFTTASTLYFVENFGTRRLSTWCLQCHLWQGQRGKSSCQQSRHWQNQLYGQRGCRSNHCKAGRREYCACHA